MTTQSQEAAETQGKQVGAGTVTVSRTVDHPLESVWKVLLTDEGAEALLGTGGRLGSKGDSWRAQDGTRGVTRSYHPLEQIRFSWHADDAAPATVVELDLAREGADRTRLDITHSHLPDDSDTAALTTHWQDALARIDADAL